MVPVYSRVPMGVISLTPGHWPGPAAAPLEEPGVERRRALTWDLCKPLISGMSMGHYIQPLAGPR